MDFVNLPEDKKDLDILRIRVGLGLGIKHNKIFLRQGCGVNMTPCHSHTAKRLQGQESSDQKNIISPNAF